MRWVPVAVTVTVLLGATACEQTVGASHVRTGELYAPGQEQYDDYFADVHSQQASAGQWIEDRKGAHRALAAALKLDVDAPDTAIVQAVHQTKPSSLRALHSAVDQTVRTETDRAKALEATATKIAEILKTGHELEEHVSEDFAKGAVKPAEVTAEMRVSFEVLAKLNRRAVHEARAAEDFVAELQRGSSTAPAAKHALPSKPRPGAVPAGSVSGPVSGSASRPPPKATNTEEVFQP
jgi:hypothetical protein